MELIQFPPSDHNGTPRSESIIVCPSAVAAEGLNAVVYTGVRLLSSTYFLVVKWSSEVIRLESLTIGAEIRPWESISKAFILFKSLPTSRLPAPTWNISSVFGKLYLPNTAESVPTLILYLPNTALVSLLAVLSLNKLFNGTASVV